MIRKIVLGIFLIAIVTFILAGCTTEEGTVVKDDTSTQVEKNPAELVDEPVNNAGKSFELEGYRAILSEKAHDVSGVATIVDERTVKIENFTYDGTGPDVFVYLGNMNKDDEFEKSYSIGDKLKRSYNNETLVVMLDDEQSLDNVTAISIWCRLFREDFGSGVFKP